MNGKRARQIRKFLNLKNSENQYEEVLTSEKEEVVAVKYQIKELDLNAKTVNADRIDTLGYKASIRNMNKLKMMYRAIKKDYCSDKKTILAALNADQKKEA